MDTTYDIPTYDIYNSKFEAASSSLIKYCKDVIIEHHHNSFREWLNYEADICFAQGYQDKFKTEFGEYIPHEIHSRLWCAGKNIIYAIHSFIVLKEDYELEELLKFVETFVSIQLQNFDDDYDPTEWFPDDSKFNEGPTPPPT